MSPKPLTIYLDEAGFTGNNLLDNSQPHFVLSSVAISADDAASVVKSVSEEFGLTAKEIKGTSLCRFPRGRDAVLKILTLLSGTFRFVCMNKRYAAACKTFEYVVEPAIAECSWFFYRERLHFFVADAIYFQTIAEPTGVLEGISTAIRERDPEKIFAAFKEKMPANGKPTVLSVLRELAINNRDAILKEFGVLKGLDEARWVMDLSSTALFSLLCAWAEQGRPLDVHCDESKPLAVAAPKLAVRIGAKSDTLVMPFGDTRKLFTLAGDVKIENSREVPGLQLADAVASAAVLVLNSPKSEFSRRAGALLDGFMDPSSMFPNSRHFSKQQADLLKGWLIIIARAQIQGMSPCQKLKDIARRSK